MEFRYSRVFGTALLVCLSLQAGSWCAAQDQPAAPAAAANPGVNAALGELQSQVQELKQMVLQLQQETSASRAEISKLRQELQVQRAESYSPSSVSDSGQLTANSASSGAPMEQQVQHLAEDEQLLTEKVNQQYQTKVESASKYRVRLSGIVLFNLFGNSGYPDNQDVPTWVLRPDPMDSSGSVGGTLRQSILGSRCLGRMSSEPTLAVASTLILAADFLLPTTA